MANIRKRYINREISWLAFNERVLQEAEDQNVPLLERLRFLGIFSSNQDEFFSVRVGTLKRLISNEKRPESFLGGTPLQIHEQVKDIVVKLRDKFDIAINSIISELEKENIYMISEKDLSENQKKHVMKYFENKVRPRLVPIMLKNVKKFPYLKNLVIYLAVIMRKADDPKKREYALIEVPADVLPRYRLIPGDSNRKYVIILDDIIRLGLKDIFSIFDYDIIEAYTIKITRDAELDIDDDITTSFFQKISESIKQRETGVPVRIVYDRNIPEELLKYIVKKNKLSDFDSFISGGRYHNARDLFDFPSFGTRYGHLVYNHPEPLPHPHLKKYKSMMKAIEAKDVMLHYPYQNFRYIIDLLREAAIDPDVTSIKMTLYRVASKSQVINSLINARRNGKSVTVVVELQARFDEEANIYWTQKLVDEGARLIDGVPGLKVHSKLLLVTRKQGKEIKHYACIGTGNFNESTARIYTDHSLLTCNCKINNEIVNLFDFLEDNYKTFHYKNLLVSPFYMRKRISRLIKTEVKNAQEGKDAGIMMKLNSLTDRKIINKFYKASQAGVRIRLLVRGICCLVPGLEGLSENIEVFSIVDKYLEHSRIYIFNNGGEKKIYISSADMMPRNLDRRVEVAVPVVDENIRNEMLDYMEIQFRDNVKARKINIDQDNKERNNQGRGYFRAQEDIYQYCRDLLKQKVNPR